MRVCPQCRSDRLVNNGSAAGKPKKRCQQCGYQFTRTTPRGKPLKTKINAVLFYLSGMSMNRIAFLLQVSTQAVLNWLRAFAKKHYEKPKRMAARIRVKNSRMCHTQMLQGLTIPQPVYPLFSLTLSPEPRYTRADTLGLAVETPDS